MFDEKNKNSNCSFAGQSISYLYGEIDAGERTAFENHLNACSMCADEIAEFGLLRRSIVDWKQASFDSLKTPAIKIPAGEIVQVKPNGVQNWLKNLKESLSLSPIWAASAAIVLIAVCAGLFLFVRNFAVDNPTAKVETIRSRQINNSPSSESKVDVALGELSNKTPDENSLNSAGAEAKNLAAKNLPANLANERIAKVSKARTVASKIENARLKMTVPVNKNNISNAVAVKTPTVKIKRLPKLIDSEEEPKNSLLLADLLDEVGGK